MLEFNVLLTSFFEAKKYNIENKFSVACWKPDWCKYNDLDFLFPTDINGLRLRLHNCNDSLNVYINELREGYIDRWDKIDNWLNSLDSKTQYILCCWCPNSSTSKKQINSNGMFFCHTVLIGKMLSIHRPDLITKLDYSRETQSIPFTIEWYKIKVCKIISGGQTGADEAGLIAAKKLGLETGGWMPCGFRTLNGKKSYFKDKYNMLEHTSYYYPPRTFLNVKESDGTIRFATNFESSGEKCTLKAIQQYKKPYFDVDLNKQEDQQIINLKSWLKCYSIKTLNVAGNSEQTSPGIQEKVVNFLEKVFK